MGDMEDYQFLHMTSDRIRIMLEIDRRDAMDQE